MNYVYFDNAASAIPDPAATEAATRAISTFANPSSLHKMGMEARRVVESARKSVALAFGNGNDTYGDIYFTSSGTEANNIALLSSAEKNKHAGNIILTTRAEHPSVGETLAYLSRNGYETVFVPVNGGEPDYDFIESALASRPVCVVALMQANNQNGAVTDLRRVRTLIEATGSKALLHSDTVQGFMKVPPKYAGQAAACCDTASVSAHKIGGLKGTGAVFIRRGLRLPSVVFGGGQESGVRSGTENVVGIAAFGAAALAYSSSSDYHSRISRLRSIFEEKAQSLLGDSISFRVPEHHTDALVSISLRGVKSEVALNYLSSIGICVSSSSACSSKSKGNPALEAFGYGSEYIDSSLRISFSPLNTEEEVGILVNGLNEALSFSNMKIRKKGGIPR